jgi:hypothetical protein
VRQSRDLEVNQWRVYIDGSMELPGVLFGGVEKTERNPSASSHLLREWRRWKGREK